MQIKLYFSAVAYSDSLARHVYMCASSRRESAGCSSSAQIAVTKRPALASRGQTNKTPRRRFPETVAVVIQVQG